MITIPLSDIKQKIEEQTDFSEEDINNKIKAKLEQLSGLISEEGAAHIIANDLGVKLIQTGEKVQVKNILPGMRNLDITGKITRKYELREFQTDKRKGKLASFIMADETGFIRVVLWNDQTDIFEKITEGDNIKIEGGYVRDNNGRKEIHINERANLTVNPEGVSVNVDDPKPNRKKLSELAEGDDNVEVLGTIVQVFDLRFFEVDPDSGRRIIEKDGKYYLGDKEIEKPSYAYVLNMFLDDGTENMRTVLWRNQVQKLLKKSHEEVLEFREDQSKFEPIKTELLGKIIKIIGRTNKNEAFERLELVANLVYPDIDPEKEMKNLEKEDSSSKESKEEDSSETSTSEEQASQADSSASKDEADNETKEKHAPKEEKKPEQTTPKTNASSEESETDNNQDEDNDNSNDDDDALDEDVMSIEDLEDID